MTSSPLASPTNTDRPRRGRRPAAIATAAAGQTPVAARRTGVVEHSIFWLLVGGLAWVPFWHGGNEPIAWGIDAMFFPGLAVLYEAGLVLRRKPHPVGLQNILLPVALFLALVPWIAFQNATVVFPVAANPAWEMAGEGAGSTLAGSISVNRDLTTAALLRLITGASVFWLGLQLCRDAGRARALVGSIALIGAVYAAYGLIAAKTGWFRMPDAPQGGVVSATFINPDSYAAFAGIGLLAVIEVFLRICRRYGVGARSASRHQAAVLIEMIGCSGAPVLAGGFVILTALLLTGSRGGIAATGLAVIALLLVARRNGARRNPVPWPVALLGFVFAGATVLLFGAVLADKLDRAGLVDPNRLAAYRLTLRSIADRPWFGWGYGTFVDVFPMYRDGSIAGSGTWSQAHNTYLEAIQGLGVVFGPLFIALVAILVLRCSKGAATRRGNATVPSLAVAAAVLVGAHAALDFSLQIQAVALTFAALLGAGVAQAASSRISLDDGAADPPSGAATHPAAIGRGWRTPVTAVAVSALCGCVALLGFGLARAAALARDYDKNRTVEAAAQDATQRWLGIPGLGGSTLSPPLARIASLDPETGDRRVAELTALLAARPLSSQAWLSLAVFRLVAREPPASILAALRLSWVTGPNESALLWQRGVFGLALWDLLPADARERTARDLARAIREELVADRQATAVGVMFDAKSADARTQIRDLLEKQGLRPADLARIGLPAD